MQDAPAVARLAHPADWIAARLGAPPGISDENNALKTGYDPVLRCWPGWLRDLGIRLDLLPEVVEPATPLGTIDPALAVRFGLSANTVIDAGTTDGCAAFLAAGANASNLQSPDPRVAPFSRAESPRTSILDRAKIITAAPVGSAKFPQSP
jgi:sugar (pentulose or hexulose) kinase